jgi:uncharacterized surface protein with fasciclin (FAS1) repeats
MKKFAGFLSVAVLSFTVVGCSDTMSPAAPSAAASMTEEARGGIPNENSRAALPTIAAIAVGNSDFSTLVAALSKAGLVETFSGKQQFTVFAPTNAAFDAAAVAILGAGKTGMDLINALDVATLTAILKYHVAQGDRNAQSVLSSGQVRMLDGNFAPVTVQDGSAFIAGAPIVLTDFLASNGIVHVIGGVMLPPSGK